MKDLATRSRLSPLYGKAGLQLLDYACLLFRSAGAQPTIPRPRVQIQSSYQFSSAESAENTPSPSESSPRYAYPSSQEKVPPILAVIIGINQYQSEEYPNLTGATHDADAFEQYLTKHLRVPQGNILSLRDKKASREAIISSFIWLRDNAAYKAHQAAIIFYFAGHGAQTQKPAEWEDWITPTGNIEMLCPSDIGTLTGAAANGVQPARQDDEVVAGIPDRTISVLLSQIAESKGTNITVILDCCSSAGMVRSTNVDRYTVRGISSPPPASTHSDDDLIYYGATAKGHITPHTLLRANSKSHVLLAACGREDFALEDPKTKRGLFTHYLLKVLEKEDIGNLTYVSLMHKLKMPERQTPHCEGDGINRRLFNNWVSGGDKSMILTKRHKEQQQTILQAGSAQGITKGSRFAAYATNLIATPLQPNPCLGYFLVSHVDAFSSTLVLSPDSPTFRLPLLFYSKLDRLAHNDICIYSKDRAWLESVFPLDIQSAMSIAIVDTQQDCDLELAVVDGYAYLYQYNNIVTKHMGSRMRHRIDAKDVTAIRAIVKASFHFHYNLTRTSPCQFDGVHMELHTLKVIMSEEFDHFFKPMGNNLIAEEPATIAVNEDDPLGVTIHNDSDRNLYPYLFYFDPSDLTIARWYLPPIGAGKNAQTTKVDAPLPARSTLAIGHGDGGARPWSFMLPPGVKKDLGFFRLFLSMRPASFESILQENSPFHADSSRSIHPPVLHDGAPSEGGEWSVQTVTMIQVDG